MDELKTIQSLGFTLPSPAYLFGCVAFSIIGYAAYRYGKSASLSYTKWIGVVLMLYPYLISDTLWLYVVGGGLCASLFIFRQ